MAGDDTLVDQGIPSIVAGDFNYINRPEEKRGGQPFVEDTGSKKFGKVFAIQWPCGSLVHLV